MLKRDQRIRDPVHNLIKFSANEPADEVLWKLIQSKPMQRLRRIKQLGVSDIVYPGATHSRFSHSLGAMQMARRMLFVLELNNAIPLSEKDRTDWHLATLCAALLHDVGHGPFSHVFEEISKELGVSIRHEQYTQMIIELPEIQEIFNKKSVFKKTASFFSTHPASEPYFRIVSSQLDADRLDFLMRDRLHTGIRFGAIDLEWLIDSLKLEEISTDAIAGIKEFSFIVKNKGLPVAEEYLSTYSKMYSAIYFHKTTRAAQIMMSEVLKNVLSNKKMTAKLPKDHPVPVYFANKPKPDLSLYLELDDIVVLDFLRIVSKGDYGEDSNIASRYFARDLYKCFEPPRRHDDTQSRERLGRFVETLKSNKLKYFPDIIEERRYKQFDVMDEKFLENILVETGEKNEYEPIARMLPHLRGNMAGKTFRLYFENAETRAQAEKLWNQL